MRILRLEKSKKHHHIHTEDVLKFGMHKASILGNIHLFHDVEKEELHAGFPYIPKEEFYKLVDELISEGELQEVQMKPSIFPPNFTQIPNEIYDTWAPSLEDSELRVLLATCRKTFGFTRKENFICESEIQQMTNLSSIKISKSIASLISKNMIEEVQPNRFKVKGDF